MIVLVFTQLVTGSILSVHSLCTSFHDEQQNHVDCIYCRYVTRSIQPFFHYSLTVPRCCLNGLISDRQHLSLLALLFDSSPLYIFLGIHWALTKIFPPCEPHTIPYIATTWWCHSWRNDRSSGIESKGYVTQSKGNWLDRIRTHTGNWH